MRIAGILLALSGLIGVIVAGGAPLSFLNIPGLLFVWMVGFGVIIAGHGFKELRETTGAILGSPKNENSNQAKTVLETAIQAFVAAGWIGVLVGTVQLLGSLDDPAHMGAGMATCLLTALYGYTMAYVVCLPLARSLES